MAAQEAASIALVVAVGAVKFFAEGNYERMLAKSKVDSLDSFIILPTGQRVNGYHVGQRHIAACGRSARSLWSPRYRVTANGRGEFISSEIQYVGQFVVDRFDGAGELTYKFPHNLIQRYVGEFQQGCRSRRGSLYLRDDRSAEYLYFEGSWKDDEPWTGTYYKPDKSELKQIADGKDVASLQSLAALAAAVQDDPPSPVRRPLLPSPPPVTSPLVPPPRPRPAPAAQGVNSPTVELSSCAAAAVSAPATVQPRVLYIILESTNLNVVTKRQNKEELEAVMRTADGTLVQGIHRGKRVVAILPTRELAPTATCCCCFSVWCCFPCCRSEKSVYYLKPVGRGVFDNYNAQNPVKYTGKFIDGRGAHLSEGDIDGASSIGSTHDGAYSDPHSDSNADWGISASTADEEPDQGPGPDDVEDPPPEPEPVRPTMAAFSITGVVRLTCPPRRLQTESPGKAMPAEIEMADGTWMAGYHGGHRKRHRLQGAATLKQMVPHGEGYFFSSVLQFRLFLEGRMEELQQRVQAVREGNSWKVKSTGV